MKEKEQHQQQRQQQKKFWDDVYDTVQGANEFHGIVVPEREKKKFFKYISDPINNITSTNYSDMFSDNS